MNLQKIGSVHINLDMICTIKYKRGKDCNAGYDEMDDLFVVITLANNEEYRSKVGSDTANQILSICNV